MRWVITPVACRRPNPKKLGRQTDLECWPGTCRGSWGRERRPAMSRTQPRPAAPITHTLRPTQTTCWECGQPLWVIYHTARQVQTLTGLVALHLVVRRCNNPRCRLFHRPYRPESEGGF